MSSSYKVYTRGGDKGETSLIGGTRVSKGSLRIESYGTVDELNSFIGLIRDHEIEEHDKKMLMEIQDMLFTIESILAKDPEKDAPAKLPEISEEDIVKLEKEIDDMNDFVEPMTSFILPGGHKAVSYCHVARCVCRRAERVIIRLNEETQVDLLSIKYINRLSDYLFALARKVSKYLNATETPWKPRV